MQPLENCIYLVTIPEKWNSLKGTWAQIKHKFQDSFNPFMTEAIIMKPVHWFAEQIRFSYDNNGLRHERVKFS